MMIRLSMQNNIPIPEHDKAHAHLDPSAMVQLYLHRTWYI